MKLVAVEFTDYSSVWWDQLVRNRHRNMSIPINSWEYMKSVMRQRFIPSHYYRDLFQRLQGLRQGSKSIEDYHKEMEMAMIRANIEEDREAIMARFLNGLNREIANVVELQHYVELEDMVYMTMKVERQSQRKGRRDLGSYSNTFRSSGSKRDEGTSYKPKTESPNPKKDESNRDSKFSKPKPTKRNGEIKCIKCLGRGHIASQCLNKRVIVLRKDREYETEEESDDDSMPPLKDTSDVELQFPIRAEIIVSRRALSMQIKRGE